MKILENVNLREYNTFMLPSIARYFVEINNVDNILELLNSDIYKNIQKKYILWEWSNTIFTKDFDGLVVKINLKWKEILKSDDDVLIKVWAGEIRYDFIFRCAENNFVWMENLAYIPSSIWASAVQNIWAYWAEAKDVIYEVEWIDLYTWETRKFKNSDCHFAYRDSIFKHELKDNFLITYVTYKLKKYSKDYKFNCEYVGINEKIAELWFDSKTITPSEFVQVITEIRKWKLPDWHEIWTAWSFFKNPVIPVQQRNDLQKKFPELKWFEVEEWIKLSAWQLIDMCGFKWKWNWKVGTYKTHALILINEWDALWNDVVNFSKEIQDNVQNKFWVNIEPEAIFVD